MQTFQKIDPLVMTSVLNVITKAEGLILFTANFYGTDVTSNSKRILPFKGNYALESDVAAHKFLRLSLHKKITKG